MARDVVDQSTVRLEPEDEPVVVLAGEREVVRQPLPSTGTAVRVTIGRGADCEIRLDDPDLSRNHARLSISDAGQSITIEDLGSTNGTSVRGTRLTPNVPAAIGVGEVVMLGKVVLSVHQQSSVNVSSSPASSSSSSSRGSDERLHERVAKSDVSVLIFGETGVGKEVFARRLHALSKRASESFVAINCAALSETLLESELFGHEKGAFTGASEKKVGLMESANGGTVLFDELGEMPLPFQAKLLRAIEMREVTPVGAVRPRPINVRFLGATHRDLRAATITNQFRADLYFRMNGFSFTLPPLRDRPQEILSLAEHFVRSATSASLRFSEAASNALRGYAWPGNVRELRNVVDRALLLLEDGKTEIDAEHLQFESSPGGGASTAASSASDEKTRILDALAQCGGNQTRAAKMLGISRRTLVSRLAQLQIPRPLKDR